MKISKRFGELLNFIVFFFFTYGVFLNMQMIMDGEFKQHHFIPMIVAFVANLLSSIVIKRIQKKEERKRNTTS